MDISGRLTVAIVSTPNRRAPARGRDVEVPDSLCCGLDDYPSVIIVINGKASVVQVCVHLGVHCLFVCSCCVSCEVGTGRTPCDSGRFQSRSTKNVKDEKEELKGLRDGTDVETM